jgi:hypothetical protein
MTDDPRKKRHPPDSDEEGANERPTVNPPFDVEAFARSASEPRASHEVPTLGPTISQTPPEVAEETRSKQITITNEVELEKARLQSARRSDPPRAITLSALSIADARSQSSPAVPQVLDPGPSGSIEAAVLGALGTQPPPEITERTIEDPAAEMRERFSLGDYTGALEMAELILAEEPGNVEAAECGENCRTVLEGMFAARLGPLNRVPLVVVPRTQMRWLSIDHRAGFILSLVDGASSVDQILDVCGMPKLDALRILYELVQQKIVAFR